MLPQQVVLESDRSSWNIVLEQLKCVGQKAWLVKKSYLNL